MNYPRIMIGAVSSGQGKTTLVCGLLKILTNQHKKVAAYKCGPDYIDPMFHQRVLHTSSKNLDTYFTEPERTRELFVEDARDKDISIIEGVMGYYDGIAGTTTYASSYELARITRTPVILTVDAKGSSLSICATIKGFLNFRSPSMIKGIILNRISEGFYERMKQAIEQEVGVPVLGYIPYIKEVVLSSRHLGLVTPEEIESLEEQIDFLGNMCAKTLDVEAIINIANKAKALDTESVQEETKQEESLGGVWENKKLKCGTFQGITIGVARDAAFSFYYQDNLRMLESMGAELIFFSPIEEQKLPEGIRGVILGGGYPEEYGALLEANESMRTDIRNSIKRGLPCMAECGGYLYLHDTLTDAQGYTYHMAGVLSGECYYTGKLQRFGYVEIETNKNQLLGQKGTRLKGHEFHYMQSTRCESALLDNPIDASCTASKPMLEKRWMCAYGDDNLYAGFPHLYYESNPEVVWCFLRKATDYEKTLQSKD